MSTPAFTANLMLPPIHIVGYCFQSACHRKYNAVKPSFFLSRLVEHRFVKAFPAGPYDQDFIHNMAGHHTIHSRGFNLTVGKVLIRDQSRCVTSARPRWVSSFELPDRGNV